jgi:N-acetylmuramic acid 6-phosphate (MurNAc-6-P) etherase
LSGVFILGIDDVTVAIVVTAGGRTIRIGAGLLSRLGIHDFSQLVRGCGQGVEGSLDGGEVVGVDGVFGPGEGFLDV